MGAREQPFVIDDLRGGRNGFDPPWALAANQCVDAVDVDFFQATLGRKRAGSANTSITFSAGGPFTGVISSAIRHVPGAADTAAELWLIDSAAVVGRLAGATTFTAPTLKDAVAANFQAVRGASINGLLFLAYDSAVDRLHVWDASTVRRTGMDTPAAPTVANTGAGAYAATIRYYKQSYTEVSGSTIVRRSELSAAVSFTPSGSGTAAQITKSAALSEGETHWEIWGSADNATFVRIANTVVGTTTYDDSTAPASYSGTAAPASGLNTNWTSVKYLLTDGNRLLGAGSWETGGKQSRVWFSPVLGSNDIGDLERVTNTATQKNWVDIKESDGGYITGFGGPLYGNLYVFKYYQFWKLIPTTDDDAPYQALQLDNTTGAIEQEAVTLGPDESGSQCLYFASANGPWRYSITRGLEYMGHDVDDLWSTINLGATSVVAHIKYYPLLRQVWWWIATGSSNDPDKRLIFDTTLGRSTTEGVRGGWTRGTGSSAAARCSVLFANTIGATMSRDLKPYIGRASGTLLWKMDSGTTDAGTTYQAYIKSKPFAPFGLGRKFDAADLLLMAKVQTGVTLTLTLDRNHGEETRTSTASLTAAGTETRKLVKFEGSDIAECDVIQFQIGDAAAIDSTWTLDALVMPPRPEERK